MKADTPGAAPEVPLPRRALRRGLFFLALLGTILTALNFALAWMLVAAMTHPPCRDPVPLKGLPLPVERWLPAADGVEIRVWYYPSQNGAAVITFGGMGGALGERLPPAAFLVEAGYGVLQVDTRACARPPAAVTQGYDERYDGEAALDFLLARPEVEAGRIGAMGFSMGGASALSLAAHRSEIRAVVRDGGFANLGALLAPAEGDSAAMRLHKRTILALYRLRAGFDPWEVSPADDLKAVAPRPVLLIYGEAEAAAGLAQADAGGANLQLWIVPDGAHGRNHLVAPEAYRRRVLDFFDAALPGD